MNVRTEVDFALLYICVYKKEKTEINCTIKKLELDFSKLFNHGKNNQH